MNHSLPGSSGHGILQALATIEKRSLSCLGYPFPGPLVSESRLFVGFFFPLVSVHWCFWIVDSFAQSLRYMRQLSGMWLPGDPESLTSWPLLSTSESFYVKKIFLIDV